MTGELLVVEDTFEGLGALVVTVGAKSRAMVGESCVVIPGGRHGLRVWA